MLPQITYPVFWAWHSFKNCRPIKYIFEWLSSPPTSQPNEGIYMRTCVFRPISPLRKETIDNDPREYFLSDEPSLTWKDINNELSTSPYKECKVGDVIDIYYQIIQDTPQGKLTSSYIVPYTYPFPIVFPPYSLEEIKESKENNPKVVLALDTDQTEYTDLCQAYVGPKNNFYADLPFRRGIRVWRELMMPPLDTLSLQIINSYGEQYDYGIRDIIDWNQAKSSDVRKEILARNDNSPVEGDPSVSAVHS